jgi:hypothetical protein
MFVPWAYRAAVAPRTALEKSYSGRMVSVSAVAFLVLLVFILPPLVARGPPGTDDPRPGWSFSVRNDHQPRTLRHPQHYKALLALGVIRIWHVQRQRVAKDRRGLIEGNAVLLEVRRSFLWVPFEIVRHAAILPSSRFVLELIGITSAVSRGGAHHYTRSRLHGVLDGVPIVL